MPAKGQDQGEAHMAHPHERRSGGGLDRREFLLRSLGAAGGHLGAPYPIPTADSPVTWKIYDDVPPIADGLKVEEGATLQIYNWDQYIWKKQVEKFCEKNGADYKITPFQNMDEALTKIRTGELKFDIFFPTSDTFGKLISSKLLQPLNHSYIPHLEENVWPQLGNPYYDQGSLYSVPYAVYTTGIAYRRNVISDEQIYGMGNPYDILWDAAYKGRSRVS